MKLILGLGNVGSRYRDTRHNAGFMVVDALASAHEAVWKQEDKLRAEVTSIEVDGETYLLAKPTTMMNASGEAAQRLMQFYKLAPKDVWVIFDDLDTPFGRLRVRQGGGSSGHQGINSTIACIGPNFVRVKVGISLNDRAVEPSEVYVLKGFSEEEREALPAVIESVAGMVLELGAKATITSETFELLKRS